MAATKGQFDVVELMCTVQIKKACTQKSVRS